MPLSTTGIKTPRPVGILWIGDSHAQGRLHTAVVSGAEVLGLYPFATPRDRHWTGAAEGAALRSDNAIGAVAGGSQDPNTGANPNIGSFTAWVPQMMRAAFPADLGVIRTANTAIGGSSAYTWSGEQASGYLSVDVNPSAGETITIAGRTYTFRVAAAAANEVTIGQAAINSAINLANAINLEGGGWGAGTTQHPTVFVPNVPGSGLFRLFAVATGVAGNALSLAPSSLGHISVYQAFMGGSAVSAQYAASKAQVPGGFGAVDAIAVTLGTNDAGRMGYRSRNMQAELTQLVANLRADYPTAPIILWRTPNTTAGGLQQAAVATSVAAVDAVIAANPTFCSAVDLYGVGLGSGDTATVSADGLHLTSYGYGLAAQMYARAICAALGLT